MFDEKIASEVDDVTARIARECYAPPTAYAEALAALIAEAPQLHGAEALKVDAHVLREELDEVRAGLRREADVRARVELRRRRAHAMRQLSRVIRDLCRERARSSRRSTGCAATCDAARRPGRPGRRETAGHSSRRTHTAASDASDEPPPPPALLDAVRTERTIERHARLAAIRFAGASVATIAALEEMADRAARRAERLEALIADGGCTHA